MSNPNPPTADLTALTQEITDTEGVEESAIALISGIKAKIDAAVAAALAANPGVNLADLTALSSRLGTERQKLADAVAANA